jgi:AcrR family transcriptional regulator
MAELATRDRILDAALDVFARKGYHRAIVDDIVRASLTSKGAVYTRLLLRSIGTADG